MTRLLDVMEDYLTFKQYRYVRLDGHTSGNDRGALIEKFNEQDSPFFIFLLSIRAGGVGVNLQAADTVIIFDTDWNPQVDLQAQARAHRLGQKKDVLVLRFETVQTVEEQVRASAEHKLGVANQSITAGFFDNNTSAEDRREYLESLLRECKKEEDAPVLDDDALNELLARSESEIDVFESIDKRRQEEEMAKWKKLVLGSGMDGSKPLPPLPSRLVTDDDLKEFYEAMKLHDVPKTGVQPNVGVKRKGKSLGGLDTQQYGRGKRAREVRSYEEQWTEDEFEKMCQVESPESPKLNEEAVERNLLKDASMGTDNSTEPHAPPPPPLPPLPQPLPVEPPHQPQQKNKDATPPSKRGRGRPRRVTADKSPTTPVLPAPSGTSKVDIGLHKGADSSSSASPAPDSHNNAGVSPSLQPSTPSVSAISCQSNPPGFSPPVQSKGQGRKAQTVGQTPPRRGKKHEPAFSPAVDGLAGPAPEQNEQSQIKSVNQPYSQAVAIRGTVPGVSCVPMVECTHPVPISAGVDCTSGTNHPSDAAFRLNSQSILTPPGAPISQSTTPCATLPVQVKGQGRRAQIGVGTHRRKGKKQAQLSAAALDVSTSQDSKLSPQAQDKSAETSPNKVIVMRGNQENDAADPTKVTQEQAPGTNAPAVVTAQGHHSTEHNNSSHLKQNDNLSLIKQPESSQEVHGSTAVTIGPAVGQIQNDDAHKKASLIKEVLPECSSQKAKSGEVCGNQVGAMPVIPVLSQTSVEVVKNQISEDKVRTTISTTKTAFSVATAAKDSLPTSNPLEGANKTIPSPGAMIASISPPFPTYAPVASASLSVPSCPVESVQSKRLGHKTTNRAETPRRRGRKPATPDVSSGQDLKVNSQPQNRSRDLLVNKATTGKSNQDSGPHDLVNVTQVHASEVHSPGTSVGHDSKRKGTSAVPAFSRMQTADVNDVARVMKEIFSETCSSKTKVGEPAGSEGRNTPTVPLSIKIFEEVVKNQSIAGKSAVSPAHEKAAAACDVPTEKSKKQSENEADAKELEYNASIVVKAPVQRADSLKPECDTHTALNENSITESNMEVDSAFPLNAGDKKDVSQATLANGGDQMGSRVQQDSPNGIDLPQAAESDKTNIEPGFKGSPKADNTGDNSRMVLSISGVVVPSINDSETKKAGTIEIYSGNEVEPSLKESPRAADRNGRSVGLNDIPAETLVSDESDVNRSGLSFNRSDMPSIVTGCSTEVLAIEGPEASDNPGVSSAVEDTAAARETATLDGQSAGSEAKVDPVPEPVLSIATESTDKELVPRDDGALQQPLVVKHRQDNGVEIRNMEVDLSETELPSLKGLTAESASRDPAPEVDGGKQLSAGDETTKGDYVEFCDTEVKPLETKSEPAMPPLVIAPALSDFLQDKNIKHSRKDADATKSEEKLPVMVINSITESVCSVPPCLAAACRLENISDSRQLSCGISITESSMEVDCKVQVSASEKDDFASQRSKSPNGDSTDLTVGPSSSQIELSVASPSKLDLHQLQNSSENKTEISSEDSPEMTHCDASNLESTIDSTNASDACNRSGAVLPTSVLMELNMACYEDKEKASLEFSNSSVLGISSSNASVACDYSGVTAVVPLSSDDSVAGSLPDPTAILAEDRSEASARGSLESSSTNVESAQRASNTIKLLDVTDHPGESLHITTCPGKSGMVDTTAMVENDSNCVSEPCPDKSGLVEAPSMIESNSEFEAEPSLKSSPSALDVENFGSAAMSTKPDVPSATSNISPSPVHSGRVELPAITVNELGKGTEPSLEVSLQSSTTERGSIEALNISTKSHALSDHCPEAAAAECCGEAIVCGPGISQKSDDHGPVSLVADIAASNNQDLNEASDNLDGSSSQSENMRDSVSDHIHLVASESENIELVPKDDKLQRSLAVERGEGNSVDVSNGEVEPSGQQASSLKDFAAESVNVEFVPGNLDEVKPSMGVESIGGNNVSRDVNLLEMESSMGKDIATVPSSLELVPGDHSEMHLQVGIASSEGDTIQVGNTKLDPLEAHATSSEVAAKESPKGEHVLNDQSQELPGIKRTEAEHFEASNVEPNSSEALASSLVKTSTVEPNSTEALASSLQSGDSDDKEHVQRSDVDTVEAGNVESNHTEGPFLSQVIFDESANPELTNKGHVRTELQTEDHAEASQQP